MRIFDLQYHLHSEMHYSELWKGTRELTHVLLTKTAFFFFFLAKLDKYLKEKGVHYCLAPEQAKLHNLPVWI